MSLFSNVSNNFLKNIRSDFPRSLPLFLIHLLPPILLFSLYIFLSLLKTLSPPFALRCLQGAQPSHTTSV